jgi:hypothetical protein
LALIHRPCRRSALAALSTAQAWPHEEAERGYAGKSQPAAAAIAARSSIMSSMTQRLPSAQASGGCSTGSPAMVSAARPKAT